MRKFFLSLVVMLVASVFTGKVYAQSSTLATLNHEGTIRTFYGMTALKEAYDEAVDGDVITLASGSYSAIDLTKAVSICGAGMGLGAAKNVEPTILLGDFKLNLPEDNTTRFSIEGIYHNGKISYSKCQNAMFLKCRLNEISYYTSPYKLKGISFVHCRIAKKFVLMENCSVSLINCIVNEPQCFNNQVTAVFDFTNCVLKRSASDLGYSTLRNCIFYNTTASQFVSSTSLYNTVVFSSASNVLDNIVNNGTNIVTGVWPSVFKTYSGKQFEDVETFELTDEAKTKYLGNDGTEVGIYGGNLPFDPTPSNPQITKCNVASKSTADGKLSVDIEVRAAE